MKGAQGVPSVIVTRPFLKSRRATRLEKGNYSKEGVPKDYDPRGGIDEHLLDLMRRIKVPLEVLNASLALDQMGSFVSRKKKEDALT